MSQIIQRNRMMMTNEEGNTDVSFFFYFCLRKMVYVTATESFEPIKSGMNVVFCQYILRLNCFEIKNICELSTFFLEYSSVHGTLIRHVSNNGKKLLRSNPIFA